MSTNGPARRRRGAAAREEALEAARDLLLSGGPAAVTLKAVGERMGVGHANLIHHFGSAAGLQGALMDRMVRDLADRIEAGLGAGRDDVEPDRLMTAVFDAFGQGGASQMAAWLALAREQARAE
ncbi:TetR family transcriptional regulator, partial [Brevundimonas sp.]|uniref:TetR/AcrR family transcriptional regulator n=1 Tax=Brevundimonas sp. TaxID=1871086 RepID=UPI002896F61C